MLEPASQNRILLLDILRGFSLIGILLPNIFAIVDIRVYQGTDDMFWNAHHLVFKGRFFTIFALVFGASFFFFARSAERKGLNFEAVATKRLLWLLVIGIPHFFAHPGEVLVSFTIFGLFLIPQYHFPPRVVLMLGIVGTVIGVFTTSLFISPGLICLGLWLGKIGYFEDTARFRKMTAITWCGALILMGPLLYLQIHNSYYRGGIYLSLAGLAISTFVVTSIVLAPVLAMLLKPLAASGRMALTVYVTQTIAVLVIDLIHPVKKADVFIVWVAIWPVQILLCILWMRFFRIGPLEWLWRWATYSKRPAFLRQREQ